MTKTITRFHQQITERDQVGLVTYLLRRYQCPGPTDHLSNKHGRHYPLELQSSFDIFQTLLITSCCYPLVAYYTLLPLEPRITCRIQPDASIHAVLYCTSIRTGRISGLPNVRLAVAPPSENSLLILSSLQGPSSSCVYRLSSFVRRASTVFHFVRRPSLIFFNHIFWLVFSYYFSSGHRSHEPHSMFFCAS